MSGAARGPGRWGETVCDRGSLVVGHRVRWEGLWKVFVARWLPGWLPAMLS